MQHAPSRENAAQRLTKSSVGDSSCTVAGQMNWNMMRHESVILSRRRLALVWKSSFAPPTAVTMLNTARDLADLHEPYARVSDLPSLPYPVSQASLPALT